MDITTVAVGVVVFVGGFFFLWRSLRPEAAKGKLKAMLDKWGATKGVWLYRLFYVVLPWFLGSSLVFAGVRGVSLARIFNK
jgi:uncharacterized membrane protein